MSLVGENYDHAVPALSSILESIGQRNLCIKVLDRDGRITAVNTRGLELLKTTQDQVCGQVWTTFWDGTAATQARQLITQALSGQTGGFNGTFHGTGEPTQWEIEACPLSYANGMVDTVLVISALLSPAPEAPKGATPEDDPETLDQLAEILHTFANVTSTLAGTSRVIRNTTDAAKLAMISDQLDQTVSNANAALAAMRSILRRDDAPTPS
ncbi:MAG: PAS domain-containing protein [Pseudomonadota bacterium]|nr:PAS domain-containing protein [Pseudomonadota bacterium]MEC8669073.1 PAS domain-containing protein [Pseudomonadota bacterium]